MTDKEIIKALCCCLNAECNECPYEIKGCNVKMCKDTLDLINRQQAEIERLKSMNQAKLDMIHDLRERLGE